MLFAGVLGVGGLIIQFFYFSFNLCNLGIRRRVVLFLEDLAFVAYFYLSG